MSTPLLQIYSGIRAALKRRVLLRGSAVAALGMGLWLWAGTFWTVDVLEVWGIPAFFIGAGLLYFGMLPYRRLIQLESKPHRVVLTDQEQLHLALNGKALFTVPLKVVRAIAYHDEQDLYGIRLWLCKEAEKNIEIHNTRVTWERYHSRISRRYDCDIFLPYFGKRAYQRLRGLCTSLSQGPDEGDD